MPVTLDVDSGRGRVKKEFYTKQELDSMGLGGGADRLMGRLFDGAASYLDKQLDDISADINSSITDAFTTAGFYYDSQINEVTDALNNSIANGGNTLSFNEITQSEANGIVVTGYDSSDNPVSRINLRGTELNTDVGDTAGIFIQKNVSGSWETNFWANQNGDLFLNGNLQLADGSVLVGTRNDPTVFISQEASFEGISVTGDTSRTVIGEGSDDQGTNFAGISIQENIGSVSSPDWRSNFYANSAGDLFLRGEIVATAGSINNLTVGNLGINNNGFRLNSDGLSLERGINSKLGDLEGGVLKWVSPNDYTDVRGSIQVWSSTGDRMEFDCFEFRFNGDVSKETGSFRIPHPNPELKDSKYLYHSFVESPTEGDNLYRYEIRADENHQRVKKELPDYFKYLNKNPQAWVNAKSSDNIGYDITFEDNEMYVTLPKKGTYNVFIITTRKDDKAQKHWKGIVREN